MTALLSPNSQAILLLTAPLIAGRGAPSADLLSPGEYQRLARHLRDLQRQPSDLLAPDEARLFRQCHAVIDESRLQHLLERGFLLSQVIERWHARAIWVVSRADAGYPRRLKGRLRDDAPAVLYGCGAIGLLETGGLAVVGSRDVDEASIDYALAIGRLAARAGRTLVSGGAKGIDQAAMRGALEAGGSACGVLADSLEQVAMTRENRNHLLDGRLALVSPYDPAARFDVGHALQRNKLIYALADAALVVSAEHDKGGTWAGATEQLDRLRLVPVYVRSARAPPSAGLDALQAKGALPWPEPQDAEELGKVFEVAMADVPSASQSGLALDGGSYEATDTPMASGSPSTDAHPLPESPNLSVEEPAPALPSIEVGADARQVAPVPEPVRPAGSEELSPADAVYAVVRQVVRGLLVSPMKDMEIASALGVSGAQAKVWLERLVEEGIVEKQEKPARYLLKRSRLFE